MLSVISNAKTGQLEVVELPAPISRPGFVLVSNRASVISAGTERATIALARKTVLSKAFARPDLVRRFIGKARRDGLRAAVSAVRARLDSPLPLGYSSAGIVLETGAGVREFAPGDRVACAGAGYAVHGEVISVPKNLCAKIPEGVDFCDAAYASLGATAIHAVRQAELSLGETAAVIGCGLIGLITVQVLAASGVKVFAVDVDPGKLALAGRLGAGASGLSSSPALAVDARTFTGGIGLDAVIVAAATPSDQPLRLAAAVARDRARIVVVGDVGMNLRRRPLYEKELTVVVSRSCGPGRYDPDYEERGVEYPLAYVRWGERRNLEEFLALVAAGKVAVGPLTTHTFPIEDALGAYDLVLGTAEAPVIGILLKYPETPSMSRKVDLAASRAPLPADKVGVALVGAGTFARSVLLPALSKTDGAALVSVVSAGGLSAAHVAKKYGFRRATTDFTEVLSDESVNAVIIATRHNLHASQAAAALAAGKNVFVEKPLALDREGLEKVREAYVAAPRVLMVGFNRRWSPHAAAVKSLFSGTSRPLAINYRVNAGPVPPDSWIEDIEEGGGRVLSEVCHFIDLAAFLAGAVKSVYAVRATGAAASPDDSDNIAVTLSFENGSVATIMYVSSGADTVPKERVEVSGAGRSALIDDFRRTTLYSAGKTRVVKTRARDKGHEAELREFVAAVKSGRMPVPFEDVYAVAAATFAVDESLRTGKPVVL